MTMATLNGAAAAFAAWSAAMFYISCTDKAEDHTDWFGFLATLCFCLSAGGAIGTVIGRVL